MNYHGFGLPCSGGGGVVSVGCGWDFEAASPAISASIRSRALTILDCR